MKTLSIILLLFSSLSAHAATYTVTRTDDRNATCNSGVDCSLREAVAAANGTADNDEINFSQALSRIILTNQVILTNNGTLSILGSGADVLTIDGGAGTNRIFKSDGATLTIKGLSLTGGNGGDGENGTGGAIFANTGSLTLDSVYVFGNSGQNGASQGGGLFAGAGTNTVITNSTFYNNVSGTGGAMSIGGPLTMSNTTITNNSATGNGYGGGLFIVFNISHSAIFRNVTIVNNSTIQNVGGGVCLLAPLSINSTLNLGNSIITGNNASASPEIGIVGGQGLTVTSIGNNLIGDSFGDAEDTKNPVSYQPTDILDTNSMLGQLQNNGGTTPTHALLPGSPAIDKGNNSNSPGATDQRGFARIVNGIIDIGAFESDTPTSTPTPTPLPTPFPPTPTPTPTPNCTYSVSQTLIQPPVPYAMTGTITVTTQQGCAWVAVSNVEWLTLKNASGTGTGSFDYALASNETGDTARNGAVTVAGITIPVNQYGAPCFYTVDASPSLTPASGGHVSFNIVKSHPNCTVENRSLGYINFSSDFTGTGGNFLPNYGGAHTNQLRLFVSPFIGKPGGIGIAAGVILKEFSQAAACTFSLTSATRNFDASGGNGIYQLTPSVPADQCQPVGASAVSNATWITFTGAADNPIEGIGYAVAPNTTSSPRTGTITVTPKNENFINPPSVVLTINQAASTCTYSLSATTVNITASGGASPITVTTQPGCSFTAASNSDFISVDYGSNSVGTSNVGVFVQANTTGTARTGTVTVAGQTLTIVQAAGKGKRIRLVLF